jgi:AcrR family transcriptional regulator
MSTPRKSSKQKPSLNAAKSGARTIAAKRRGRPPLVRVTTGTEAPDDIRGAVAHLKRERIVAAAVDLFYRQGYERTTLDQVAESLDVTKPFIYSHFSSKADLLAEICSRAIRHAHQGLNRILVEEGSQSERLSRITCEFLIAVLDNQPHAVIYSREETELKQVDRDAINQMRRDFDRQLIKLLDAGVKAGEFSIDDVPLTALAIGGLVGWAPVWYRSNGRLSKLDVAQYMASLALNMVKAKRPSSQRVPKVATHG